MTYPDHGVLIRQVRCMDLVIVEESWGESLLVMHDNCHCASELLLSKSDGVSVHVSIDRPHLPSGVV